MQTDEMIRADEFCIHYNIEPSMEGFGTYSDDYN